MRQGDRSEGYTVEDQFCFVLGTCQRHLGKGGGKPDRDWWEWALLSLILEQAKTLKFGVLMMAMPIDRAVDG